jgi:hypothetical protein
MTASVLPMSTEAVTDVQPAGEVTCDVCPHRPDDHDAIGKRFCQATLDGALPRGCACRSA